MSLKDVCKSSRLDKPLVTDSWADIGVFMVLVSVVLSKLVMRVIVIVPISIAWHLFANNQSKALQT